MRHTFILTFLTLCFCAVSCVDVDEYPDTTTGNMEALWHIMDERYCFFEEKGVDWDAVHREFQAQAVDGVTQQQEFDFLCAMLARLRDGHVNLATAFDYGRNWSWKEDYPANFSPALQGRYLGTGTDYRIASGIKYRILPDNIGYIALTTFENEIGDGNLDNILLYLQPCLGLIIDVRGNSGGKLTEAQRVAARFAKQQTLVGYICHKTGPGHTDFSDKEPIRLQPSAGVRWNKPCAVLTNRAVFSAANEFVKYMKAMPGVTIVGDNTGGGSGMPYTAELPNGWTVRYSACPMYDKDGNSTEAGIEPDIRAELDEADAEHDNIIDTARRLMYN